MYHDLRERLVAHRGCPASRVENTLAGVKLALASGAHWLEIDLQLTADGIPVLHHDRDLVRLAGEKATVADLTLDELSRLRLTQTVDSPQPSQGREDSQPPCGLAVCVDMVAGAGAHLFAEVKSVAVERFGVEAALDRVLPVLAPLADRVTLIASRADLLEAARVRCGMPIGWILPVWTNAVLEETRQLAPETAFINVRKIPESVGRLPEFGGRWIVYVVDDATAVQAWLARGAALVETDRIDVLLGPNASP